MNVKFELPLYSKKTGVSPRKVLRSMENVNNEAFD